MAFGFVIVVWFVASLLRNLVCCQLVITWDDVPCLVVMHYLYGDNSNKQNEFKDLIYQRYQIIIVHMLKL